MLNSASNLSDFPKSLAVVRNALPKALNNDKVVCAAINSKSGRVSAQERRSIRVMMSRFLGNASPLRSRPPERRSSARRPHPENARYWLVTLANTSREHESTSHEILPLVLPAPGPGTHGYAFTRCRSRLAHPPAERLLLLHLLCRADLTKTYLARVRKHSTKR